MLYKYNAHFLIHCPAYVIVLLSFLFIPSIGIAQTQEEPAKTKVYLLHSDVLRFNKKTNPDAQIVDGNVVFRHDSLYMYCDSAYFYSKTNSLEAFGHIKMNQGDTLFLYGKHLFYDGNSQIAMVRGDVQMIHKNTVLTTDSLNYDRVYNLGYYFDGGELTDQDNVLTSNWGQYSPATKVAVFNHEVHLTNPKFVLASDTLRYSTQTKIATILGPSTIDNGKNHIYSELGYYDTQVEQAHLLNRSVLYNGGKQLTGDSLFYDRKVGYGKAFSNVEMNDTIGKSLFMGNYCYYDEKHENVMATERAVVVDYSQGDSLFLHADTLRMNTYNINTDSTYKLIRAYHKVRAYRHDLQASCDSLVFNSKDSCMTFYKDPVVWNQNQQLLGEEIRVYMNDSTIDWAHIINQALAVEKKDSINYNQVSGKEMKAFFQQKQIRRSLVTGNVQVAFYLEEKNKGIIAFNSSETSILDLYLKDRQLEKAVMKPQTNGTTYPMDQIPEEKRFLSNFVWLDYMRPKSKEDIFNWVGKKADDKLKQSKRSNKIPTNHQIILK